MDNTPRRHFWTDGSAKPNPGPGGFAVIERYGDRAVYAADLVVQGKSSYTTSVRMEGKAIVEAIKMAGDEKCTIHTDSRFWINVATKWISPWARNGWKKKTPGPIKNIDLVKELYDLLCYANVKFVWVKGHRRDELNNYADYYAKQARDGVIQNLPLPLECAFSQSRDIQPLFPLQ